MNNETIPLRSIIRDIYCMGNVLEKLLDKKNSYNQILQFFLDYSKNKKNEDVIPGVMEISRDLKIPYSSTKKNILLLHADIIDLAGKGDLFKIEKHSYVFYISGIENSVTIQYNQLPHIPQVGENIQFPCFDGYLNCGIFHVESITHEYMGNELVISFFLQYGLNNNYYHFKLDEAKFKRLIPYNEFFSKNKYSLEKQIKELF